jgi:phage gp45-like
MNLDTIKRKFFLLIGKALLSAINNTGEVGYHDSGGRPSPQRISVNFFGPTTDIERVQEYGLETYPVKGTAEAVLLSLDGSKSTIFAIAVKDDKYRPTDGRVGETIQYDDKNARMSCNGGKIAIGNPSETLTSTPSGGKAEAMEIIDRLFTLLQSDVNLGGAASGTKLITALPELAKLQTDWNKIKGSFV